MMPKSVIKIITSLSRLMTLSFAVLAIFAFVETREILNNSTGPESYKFECSQDGKSECSLKIPLILCVPESIEVNGRFIYSDHTQGVAQCQQLDFLINACGAGLFFASIASFIFIVIDFMARRKKGPFNMSTAAGMGLFLFFIMLQTGIATGALVQQTNIWVDFYQELLEKLQDADDDYAKTDAMTAVDISAESYGNVAILTCSYLLAFCASGFIVIDFICYRFCGGGTKNYDDDSSTPAKTLATTANDVKINDVEKQEEPVMHVEPTIHVNSSFDEPPSVSPDYSSAPIHSESQNTPSWLQ